jgi:hypothetical protein
MKLPIQGGVRRGRRLFVPLLLGLLAALPAARAQDPVEEEAGEAPPIELPAARKHERLAPDAHVARVLRSSRFDGAPSNEKLAEELVAPGVATLAPLFAILEARRVPLSGLEGEKIQKLSEPQREIVLTAFGLFGRKPVLAALEKRLAEGAAAGRPLAAIDTLGAVGEAREIARVIELVPAGEEEAHAKAVSDAFARILRRDAGGQAQVASLYPRVAKPLRPAVLDAIGVARDPRALSLLSKVLQEEPELVANAVAKVRLVGRSARPELNESVARSLRERITDPDDRHARAAVIALGELGDVESLPRILELLEIEGQPALAENALWALRRASGIADPPKEEGFWQRWLEGESRWYASERPSALERLVSKRPDQVVSALRALASHRLYRDELAPELALVLDHDDASLRSFACQMLGELGSALSIETLVGMRDDRDPKVRAAAQAALTAMRARELPRDAPTWSDAPRE